MDQSRRNFLCNFRAPNDEWFQVWIEFKATAKEIGLDICFVILTLCRAWVKAQKEGVAECQLEANSKILFIFQANTFNYNVAKPRRERFQIDCSKNLSKCTLCSRAFQSYIIETARELDRSFSFKDFTEINHELFRKLILELKKRQKILPMQPRSNPETYILPEWKPRYPTMNGNNIVKPTNAGNCDESPKGAEF